MVIYSIENRYGKLNQLKKVLHMEGKIGRDHAEELRAIIFDAVKNCDHLEVNLERIDECDPSFNLFICYTHKLAQQFNTRLSLKGKFPMPDFRDKDLFRESKCEDMEENSGYYWNAVIRQSKNSTRS